MKTLAVLVFSSQFLMSATVFAGDDGLDAGTSLKVNRAKRHQSMEKSDKSKAVISSNLQKADGDPCKGVEIGNVYTDGKVAAVPRENTVVVTGDVINIPSSKCR
ncbi:MAG: hypothetical protein HXX17_10785 [Geobacteraceae bacterium]|nr:hypothetical protein [Geobacteraceae bacterium]